MNAKLLGRVLSTSVLIVGFGSGCGGGGGSVSYGTPTQPTGSQMQAISTMTDVSNHLSVAISGKSDANKAFDVHSLMGSLQGTAINQSGGSQGLGLVPADIDASCTTGTAATGFTYNDCKTTNGTISGSIAITPTSVTYKDLKITGSSSGGTASLVLNGNVTVTAGHLTGDLNYKISTDFGALGSLGSANTDITTDATWDITYTDTPSCITAGSIEVKVDYAGTTHGAKFTFAGCNMVTVQNG